jgi:hypothetical protein
MATGTLIFSHILPVILGFFGILLLISGVMDDEEQTTILGIGLFILAAVSPFIILTFAI